MRKEKEISVVVDQGKRYANITEQVVQFVKESGVRYGTLFVQSMHTTCSLVFNEAETGLLAVDLPRALDRIAPVSSRAESRERIVIGGEYYAHDDMNVRAENLAEDGERVNGHAHLRAMLVGQEVLPLRIRKGEILLGKWQSILFFDFDDQGIPTAKERTVFLWVMSDDLVPFLGRGEMVGSNN